MAGSLGSAFVLLAVVLLVAVALSVLVIVLTAAERDEDPVVAAADGPGLLARRDGGARARARFERAEQLVLRGVGAGGRLTPSRERVTTPLAAPAAAPASRTASTASTPTPAPTVTPGPAPSTGPAQPASQPRPAAARSAAASRPSRPVIAPSTGDAPARVDLTAVEGRGRAEVVLRAPTAVPGLAEETDEQAAARGTGDGVGGLRAGAAARAVALARAAGRRELPPVVHRVTERLVARVFDPFGSPEAADRPAPATAGPAQEAVRPSARPAEGRAALRSAGPQ